MGEHTIKLPDVGEGVAEAELVEWHVKVGDIIREDAVIAAVMTDKATVEIPSPVSGTVVWVGGEVGQTIPVGSSLARIAIVGAVDVQAEAGTSEQERPTVPAARSEDAPLRTLGTLHTTAEPVLEQQTGVPRAERQKPLASPSVRLRAKEAGIDLRQVAGSGPAGRVEHNDIEAFIALGSQPPAKGNLARKSGIEEIKVVGLRRRISEKMALAKSRIPHITYVDEVDVTTLEELRATLNSQRRTDRAKLTILPFLMRAIVKAVEEQPQFNALFDDDAGIVQRHHGVHIGIAAQTPGGLMVPVVRHAEARDIWDCAAEAARLADAARAGTAQRDDLMGSTITITSLGAMGGLVTTPIINHPEVAIVGVNRMAIRPMWDGAQFMPRKMMNLSSSFDHRVIDGWDAAVFVQRLKTLLEAPALIFVED